MLPRQGAELILPSAAAGEGLGLVSRLLQVARDKGSRASLGHPHHHMADERGTTCCPIFMPSGPAFPCPCEQGQLDCAAQVKCSTLSPECFHR